MPLIALNEPMFRTNFIIFSLLFIKTINFAYCIIAIIQNEKDLINERVDSLEADKRKNEKDVREAQQKLKIQEEVNEELVNENDKFRFQVSHSSKIDLLITRTLIKFGICLFQKRAFLTIFCLLIASIH